MVNHRMFRCFINRVLTASLLILPFVPAFAATSKPPKARPGAGSSLPLGRAEGTITINGEPGSLKFAYAKAEKWSDGEKRTVILLTDKPVPAKIIKFDSDTKEWAKKTGAHLVTLDVMADKSLGTVKVFHGTVDVFHARMKSKDAAKNLDFENLGDKSELILKTQSGARVEGRARTTRTEEWLDARWTFDVRFNAPLGESSYGENPIASKELAAERAKRTSNLAQGKAKGTLTVDGKTVNMKYAYARMQKHHFDEKKKEMIVILSDHPLEPEVLRSENLGRKLGKLMDQGKFQGLLLNIDDSERPDYVGFYHPLLGSKEEHPSRFRLAGGELTFAYDSIRYNEKTVEGRFFTDERWRPMLEEFFAPRKLLEHCQKVCYSYDVTFHAFVEQFAEEVAKKEAEPPKIDAGSGKKLPAGGGEPGKAYMAYLKAIEQGKIEEMVRFLPEDALTSMPDAFDPKDEESKKMMKIIQKLQQKNVKITDGYVSGDKATLYVNGIEAFKGQPVKGTISMVKQKGTWRIKGNLFIADK